MTPLIQTAQLLLKDVFGYDTFRPLQQKIIENILKKNDSLVIMPTGGGKSLCYQLPALMFDGLTIGANRRIHRTIQTAIRPDLLLFPQTSR